MPRRALPVTSAAPSTRALPGAAPAAGNLVLLEHVNLTQPDQALATLFYVVGLGLTRDPYLMVGLDNMWINVGPATQLHLPTRAPQRLRGRMVLALPELDGVERSLAEVAEALAGTAFSMARVSADELQVSCPWGNRLVLQASRPGDAVRLGLTAVELDVPPGHAEGIARFYAQVIGAAARCEAQAGGQGLNQAVVDTRRHQQLRFVETTADLPGFDGHHLQVYLDDAAGAYARCRELGIVSRDRGPADWRFILIVDPDDGRLLYQLEHEVRDLQHPLYGRALVNRNPAQRQASYQPGQDAWLDDGSPATAATRG
ncbi:MAG: hypothetical protein RIQ60_2096 [Pseudomonadota bacterium]|jgi:hypothetical protein